VFAAGPLAAEPAHARFSLLEAVDAALTRQPALAVRREEIARHEALLQQTAGEFDPLLSARFSAVRSRTPGVNREALNFQSYLRNAGIDPPALTETLDPFAATNAVRLDDFNYQLNFAHKLRNGIVYGPQAFVNVNEGLSPATTPLASGRLGFVIQIPLLRGLGRSANGAREAAARGEADVARLLYRHELAAQVARTAAAYWTARAAAEIAAVQRDTAARAVALLETMRTLVRGSILPPTFVSQAEANVLSREAVRLEADLASAQARIELGRSIGLPAGEIVAPPEPADPFPALGPLPDLAPAGVSAWIPAALAARADHLAARRARDPAALLARQAAHNLLPRADLSLQTGYAGLAPGRQPLDGLRERRTSGNAAVTLELDWPLRNNFRQGQLREARAREREIESRLAAVAADIAAEVVSAAREASLRADLVRAADLALALAERAVADARERLGLGESSLPDVIGLENALIDARIRQIAARAGYAGAIVRFRFSVGAIFTDGGTDAAFAVSSLTTLPALP
jgi:outer membrane protein TolC